MLSGFINLYKYSDMSSNKALSILKKHLKKNNIATKVGHMGTLDPIAEGVLPVALGRATRLFDYTLDKIKSYRAVFEFGVETDTLDRTGAVVNTGRKNVTEEEIQSVLPKLKGNIMQVPPSFSAKNVNGERAYRMARKGENFILPPKQVHIYDIKLLRQIDEGIFELDIDCGGGTYIRSIARDIAYLLGTVGRMNELIRTKNGEFSIENSVKLENLDNVLSHILPMEYVLKYEKFIANFEQYKKIINGVEADVYLSDGAYTVYSPENLLMGIGKVLKNKLRLATWLL